MTDDNSSSDLSQRLATGGLHPYDWSVERIKSLNDTSEARAWLEKAGKDYGVIHELSHEESVEVVEECYRRGAELVEVMGDIPDNSADSSVNMLLITLPSRGEDREQLYSLEAAIAEEAGFEPSIDEGQNLILLRWT